MDRRTAAVSRVTRIDTLVCRLDALGPARTPDGPLTRLHMTGLHWPDASPLQVVPSCSTTHSVKGSQFGHVRRRGLRLCRRTAIEASHSLAASALRVSSYHLLCYRNIMTSWLHSFVQWGQNKLQAARHLGCASGTTDVYSNLGRNIDRECLRT